jgi:hypothetical protein
LRLGDRGIVNDFSSRFRKLPLFLAAETFELVHGFDECFGCFVLERQHAAADRA